LAAPDSDTIDEWWRVVSEKAGVQWNRLAPDYYSFNNGLVWDSAPEFNDRLMYTLLNDRDGRFMGAFSQQPRTDHISGQTYVSFRQPFHSVFLFFFSLFLSNFLSSD
jgi:hypothetical protein